MTRLSWSNPSKYHARKVIVNGETFDSEKEYRRWCELRLLERAGEIRYLKRQVPYVLVPAQRDQDGKLLEREVTYKADFVYDDTATGRTVVEDTKGVRTPEYILKRKLMLWAFGIRIYET